MKKTFLLTTFIFLSFQIFSQNTIVEELEELYNQDQFDKIISEHAEKVDEYPARAIYYVGMAYYMKSDDQNCLKYIDMSIEKDNQDPDAYFIKGMTYNYMKQYKEGIQWVQKAIELDNSNSNYYSGLADTYYNLKDLDKALENFLIATEKENPLERAFVMVSQIYGRRGNVDEALKYAYLAKEKLPSQSDMYPVVLYNIGIHELFKKDLDKAEVAFNELIELVPSDYQTYSNLIQIYYAKKEYQKAEPYRERLYDAYNKGILKDPIKEMYCFDQFEWKDKFIMAYERFATKEGELYYKHIFYILNELNETEFTIQTENSPVSVELGGPKYAIGMDINGGHATFGFIKENFNYDDLKSYVLKILNKEVAPTAATTYGKASNENEEPKKKPKKKKKRKDKRKKK